MLFLVVVVAVVVCVDGCFVWSGWCVMKGESDEGSLGSRWSSNWLRDELIVFVDRMVACFTYTMMRG